MREEIAITLSLSNSDLSSLFPLHHTIGVLEHLAALPQLCDASLHCLCPFLLNFIDVGLNSLEYNLLLALSLDKEQRMVVVVNRFEELEVLALLHD